MVMFHRFFVCLPGRVTWINMDQSGANNAIFTTHFSGNGSSIPPIKMEIWMVDGAFMALFYPHK
jgi:hypothetical protein